MPRIDPLQLLNCLNVLLSPTGGIKSEQEVARISSLMEKFSKKLVSKCVYLLILKASDVQLLSKFMGLGGWNLIYNWLLHAVEAKNFPFLIELLEVIVICPVDIERLKSNPMPRQIKCLSKDYTVHPRVRDLASEIVKLWLAIVKGTPAVVPAPVPVVNNVDASTGPVPTKVDVAENNQIDSNDNQVTQPDASEEESMEEDAEDGNYVRSPSSSSSSVETDDADEFIPNKKPVKRPAKSANKKEKVPRKKQADSDVEAKLKAKLVTSVNAKESKRGSTKLKIEKKKTEIDEVKSKKEVTDEAKLKKELASETKSKKEIAHEAKPIKELVDEAKSKKELADESKSKKETLSAEERLKMKRKLKEDKEKEKFAKFKQERDKKDKTKDKRDDGSKDKTREDKIREDKYKNELSKLIPKSLDKLGRIPKKPKETTAEEQPPEDKAEASKPKADDKKAAKKDEKSSATKPKEAVDAAKKEKEAKKPQPLPVPPKKPVSMSVEKRFAAEEKPKTVKAYNSKFRLTGLEEVIPKPPSRKPATAATSNSSTHSSTPPIDTEPVATPSSPLVEKTAVKRSPTKDVEIEPAEKMLKSPDVSMSEDKSSPTSSKSKKPFLQESDFFMNAMTIAIESQKESLRKRKKAAPKADSETKADENGARKNSDPAASPTIKSEKDVKPTFKFYKDTLDTSIEENAHENVEVPDIKIAPDDIKPLEDIKNVKPKIEPEAPKVGLKSALSIFRGKKLPKKSVKWRRDDELESVQYFEVDASERTNVVRTFWDMQMMERTKERESMLMVRKNAENDKMAIQTKWKPLTPVDVPASSVVRGGNSQEKSIQYARERAVPPALYFNKSMVPDTPAEPDLEIHPVTIPPVIPLDDITGSQDSITDFSSYKWPEPKLCAPDGSEIGMMAPGFMPNAAGMPQPIFPPFPPFGQPFFPGGPVPPANWVPPSNGDQSQQNPSSMPMNWPPPPNLVPPVAPGMMAPPFGMMGPPFPPIPGPGFPGAPNMFPPSNMNQQPVQNSGSGSTTSNSDSQSYSNSNNYSSNSESSSSSRKWSSDDRYSSRKDGWKSNYSDRSRDKRSSSWRSSNRERDSRLCRTYQKKGYCNAAGCRFYHEDD